MWRSCRQPRCTRARAPVPHEGKVDRNREAPEPDGPIDLLGIWSSGEGPTAAPGPPVPGHRLVAGDDGDGHAGADEGCAQGGQR